MSDIEKFKDDIMIVRLTEKGEKMAEEIEREKHTIYPIGPYMKGIK